ncbi:ParB/RepB/Spo0J family partition protein [Kitasatospora sp. NPDC088264]|uniref:ParB/RepB/Spo0J family partition protein n=1 Tax=Kitasatospora sp. NPDC088264 TaxID=3155296 RepID=UPI003415803E
MFKQIEIDQIMANPEQPRKFFDEAAHQELVASIKQVGILQPVAVRPVEGKDVPYLLIMGERRWRAAKEAGLTDVPARVIENMNDVEAYILSITENVVRADMTILEEAGAYADLAALGWDAVKIGAQFGKTETHIKWRLGLLTLRPEVAAMVEKGEIKPNLAWHIAQLSPQHQIIAANRYVRGDFDSEADAANYAQGLKMAEQQTSLITEEGPSLKDQEKQKKEKAKAADKLSKVEAIMPLLDELTKHKPEELAQILGGDLARYVREIDKLANRVTLARRILRQANGIHEAVKTVAETRAAEKAVAPAAKAAEPKTPAPRTRKAAVAPKPKAATEPKAATKASEPAKA